MGEKSVSSLFCKHFPTARSPFSLTEKKLSDSLYPYIYIIDVCGGAGQKPAR